MRITYLGCICIRFCDHMQTSVVGFGDNGVFGYCFKLSSDHPLLRTPVYPLGYPHIRVC